jgi:neutral ceramidase
MALSRENAVRTLRRFGVAILACISFAPACAAATLKAGVAKADITPPAGEHLWGYGGRKAPATGMWDPLYARVLVLEAGDQRVAIVELDLGRVFGPASVQKIRDDAKQSSGISYVLITAIHTHAGPVVEDNYENGPPAWETAAIAKIGEAIREAHEQAVDARLGTGYGVVFIAHNRLRDEPDGTVTWFQTNATMVPTAPVDPTVSVLRIDTAAGKPLAILVNYACHPVIFGPDNLKYSADFVGVMAGKVEAAFDARPMCLYLQGGDGDLNPYYAVTPLEQDAVGRRNWTGETLADEVIRVGKSINTVADRNPTLEFAEDLLPMKARWNLEKYRVYILKSEGAWAADEYIRKMTAPKLPVATVLIDKRIAVMTMPGEPFVQFQEDWRRRCPVPDAFFVGYANAHWDYFPTIRQASIGGYGAASASTQIEPDAGAIMVNHAVAKVYEMLGKLTDAPEDLHKTY